MLWVCKSCEKANDVIGLRCRHCGIERRPKYCCVYHRQFNITCWEDGKARIQKIYVGTL